MPGDRTPGWRSRSTLRLKELAALWSVPARTIRRLFADESGVLRIGTGKVMLSIPESIAARVHERLSAQPIPARQISRAPLRVVKLRDFHERIAKQPRTVIKLRAGGVGGKSPDTPE